MSQTTSKATQFLPFVALLAGAIMLLSASCQNTKQMSAIDALQVLTATRTTSFPGAQSNLRSTTKYEVKLTGKVAKEITVKYILVDSIQIPVRSVSWDGVDKRDELISGEVKDLIVSATRYSYDTEAAIKQVDEEQYTPSGRVVANGLELAFQDESGQMHYLAVENVVKKQPIYYP